MYGSITASGKDDIEALIGCLGGKRYGVVLGKCFKHFHFEQTLQCGKDVVVDKFFPQRNTVKDDCNFQGLLAVLLDLCFSFNRSEFFGGFQIEARVVLIVHSDLYHSPLKVGFLI